MEAKKTKAMWFADENMETDAKTRKKATKRQKKKKAAKTTEAAAPPPPNSESQPAATKKTKTKGKKRKRTEAETAPEVPPKAKDDTPKQKRQKPKEKPDLLLTAKKKEIQQADVQALVKYVFKLTTSAPHWITVPQQVKRVMMIGIGTGMNHPFPESSEDHCLSHTDLIPFRVQVSKLTDMSYVQELFQGESTSKPQTKKKKSKKQPPLSHYVLSPQELADNDYPLTLLEEYEGYTLVGPAPKGVEIKYKAVAIDCEMVQTESGFALARCTVLDYETEKVLFDKLVKPDEPVTDYVTRFSGITEEKLKDVTYTLADCQRDLLEEFLFAEVICIGQSLENDLKCLKLIHLNVVDTALAFPHPYPPAKYALRVLAKKHLKMHIQVHNPANPGHNSAEDSLACIRLMKAKVRNGPAFGVPLPCASLLDDICDAHAKTDSPKTVVIDRPWALGSITQATCMNYPNLVKKSVKTDEEALKQLLAHTQGKDDWNMAWVQLHGLRDHLKSEWRKVSNDERGYPKQNQQHHGFYKFSKRMDHDNDTSTAEMVQKTTDMLQQILGRDVDAGGNREDTLVVVITQPWLPHDVKDDEFSIEEKYTFRRGVTSFSVQ
eukprot:TRINITY_DN42920_c0_g1_i1.p1 TRINITY_DN42920_c0_g1~~TRINITY_DN42920_c0_g1_i1.p1  ORF type:complete len:605 (+),score=51.38 TRINITY_DN42920_c0_g1_i1:37-1851(+)